MKVFAWFLFIFVATFGAPLLVRCWPRRCTDCGDRLRLRLLGTRRAAWTCTTCDIAADLTGGAREGDFIGLDTRTHIGYWVQALVFFEQHPESPIRKLLNVFSGYRSGDIGFK